MTGGMSKLSTAAGPSGGRKRKGETPMGEFGTSSTLNRSIRRAREMVKRCCSCIRHSTCSTKGPSARACECRNAGRQCTGCYCWGKCRNKGRLMPSPNTVQGLLGHFPQVADPPANDPRATTPPVQLPTSSSLRAILAAVDGGRSVWGGGERPQGPSFLVSPPSPPLPTSLGPLRPLAPPPHAPAPVHGRRYHP